VNCSTAEHACAAGSGERSLQKIYLCLTSGIDIWWNYVQLPYTKSCQRDQRFERWLGGEHGKTTMHPGCARQWTTGIMIIDSMLLSAQISDPCCGVIVDCVRYVLAKGHVILSSDQPRNMIAIWRRTAARTAETDSNENTRTRSLQHQA
jgi:hypothetical protein